MSLFKKEEVCISCSKQYILVFKPEDVHDVSYCPFCGSPVEAIEYTSGDDE